MDYIVSGKESSIADKIAINDFGIPSLVLMERASLEVKNCIIKTITKNKKILVVSGVGNNGADGLAVARMLFLKGYLVDVFITSLPEKGTEEFKTQFNIINKLGIDIVAEIKGYDVYVDAIFGVGLSRDIEGKYRELINDINAENKTVYAVDIPSGVNSNNGKIMNTAIKADYTITFSKYKIGNVLYPGAKYCGKIIVADIGIPKVYKDSIKYIEKKDLKLLPRRIDYSNKGTYGKVLLIAGNKDITGACILCARAILSMGAGMLQVLSDDTNVELLRNNLPEAMVASLNENTDIDKYLKWCDVIAIGPGIGVGDFQQKIIKEVLKENKPTVIDADGINNISKNENLKNELRNDCILTPHLKEMSLLIDKSVNMIQNDLIQTAIDAHNALKANIVLKDARTVSVSDGTYINMSGNNGMATAGSGDVLTGIIAGLLAVGMNHTLAPPMGAYIHGLAGDMAAKKKSKASIIASDIINELPNIME